MAGTNKILKPGEHLFHEGAASDGMYIVRKGEILIYLEKGGNEIRLAKVNAGAMIGEMALFDNKARSASAKALDNSEVTKINKSDFIKLMKQIPNWFVTLMSSLSSRLRDTNERLQVVEAKLNSGDSFIVHALKLVRVIRLVWFKEGVKEGKNWNLDYKACLLECDKLLDIDKSDIESVLNVFSKEKLFTVKQGSYNNKILSISNRGYLDVLSQTMEDFIIKLPHDYELPSDISGLFLSLAKLINASPYDSGVISLEELIAEGKKHSYSGTYWKTFVGNLVKFSENLQSTKNSQGQLSIKASKKHIMLYERNFTILMELQKL